VTSAVPAGRVADDVGDVVEVVERRKRFWTWAACVGVLSLATAATVALLFVQWMSSGSGTVAR
jgi:hypothetical protein